MDIIRKGLWSTAYKSGSYFIKQLNFNEPKAAEREAKASCKAQYMGIFTPHYNHMIFGDTVMLFYDYINITKITNEHLLSNKDLFTQLITLFNNLSLIPWNPDDNYWYSHITQEFEYELSLLHEDTKKYMQFMRSLIPSVFIHGDCSVYNMGLVNDRLIIFDFQHGSYGPAGWDKAYFASTMKMQDASIIPLNETERKMVELISAVKLGRSIKKNLPEIPIRAEIYKSWKSAW